MGSRGWLGGLERTRAAAGKEVPSCLTNLLWKANAVYEIDITGGNSVTFSNIKVTFGGDATTHFGVHAFSGVVRNSE